MIGQYIEILKYFYFIFKYNFFDLFNILFDDEKI